MFFWTSFTFAQMTTGELSRNVSKLFSKLKLVTDNLALYLGYYQFFKARLAHTKYYAVTFDQGLLCIQLVIFSSFQTKKKNHSGVGRCLAVVGWS